MCGSNNSGLFFSATTVSPSLVRTLACPVLNFLLGRNVSAACRFPLRFETVSTHKRYCYNIDSLTYVLTNTVFTN